ncbi:hypothetical protein RB595_005871 [Gaeumannomyces hyphopodioides]
MPSPRYQRKRTVLIHARYIDEFALMSFLVRLFGANECEVEWTRGYYQCTLPRGLKPRELEALRRKVDYERYEEK